MVLLVITTHLGKNRHGIVLLTTALFGIELQWGLSSHYDLFGLGLPEILLSSHSDLFGIKSPCDLSSHCGLFG